MNLMKLSVVPAVALLISACGGGGSGNSTPPLCRSISGGGTQIVFTPSAGCTNCSSNAASQSIDNNFDTAGTMSVEAGGSATLELKAVAQSGIVYPAGTDAGMVYAATAPGQSGAQLSLRTYLNGVQNYQYAMTLNVVGAGGGVEKQKIVFDAPTQFDAISFFYSRSAGTGTADLKVFEFCADQ